MAVPKDVQPIVIYQIEHHPLEVPGARPGFQWLRMDAGLRRDLEGLIGRYDPRDVTLLTDRHPSGPAWSRLLRLLLEERVRMVVTHLAPLTSAQRQQLIGLCAHAGALLITPADAGRRRTAEAFPRAA